MEVTSVDYSCRVRSIKTGEKINTLLITKVKNRSLSFPLVSKIGLDQSTIRGVFSSRKSGSAPDSLLQHWPTPSAPPHPPYNALLFS